MGRVRLGSILFNIQTALYATIAIQAALLARHRTGLGQHIDLALLDVQLAGLANQGMNYLTSGKPPTRSGNSHPNVVPYQTFKAKNSEFIVACGNDTQFKALCYAIELPHLLDNPDYAHNQDRVKHRDSLVQLLSEHFLTQDAEYWLQRIQKARLPVGIINNIEQALQEPQVQAREMVVSIKHPLNPDFKMIGSPIKLSGTPIKYQKAPPLLGEHTAKVLSEFCTAEQLRELAKRGVIAGLDLN